MMILFYGHRQGVITAWLDFCEKGSLLEIDEVYRAIWEDLGHNNL